MLKQRVLTAAVLAPLAIGGVFFLPFSQFQWFVVAVIAIAGWEWANLGDLRQSPQRVIYALVVAALLWAVLSLPPGPVLAVAALFWMWALFWVCRFPASGGQWQGVPQRAVIGLLVLLPAGVALVVLKGMSASNQLLVLLFLLVWGADIGAYFAGRRWGGAKLAPHVSPGKTRAGLYGGLVTSLLITLIAGLWWQLPVTSLLALLLVGLVTALASVLGDLLESMFKRHRGIKDSSALLPGHGGVLDRIDSLTAAAPVYALGTTVSGLGSLLATL
ncbi:phosphatidate cytidylyltransferase [Motiliproteus sediminis]|uniref:phosphatidate cytidylyltransferase n=1 Tax=Motiliproteus sediminis TaxID=1468178 RepID=UPI001AF016B1|nr:phosphatidate cytidylyltransferase [Motiliproteus sediminis]